MIADFLTDDDPLDLEQMSTPRTAREQAQLCHAAARTLLDIVAAILEEWDNRQ